MKLQVIQNFANGVTFGQKEEYMKDLNPFIEANMPAMQVCIVPCFHLQGCMARAFLSHKSLIGGV